jgi:hypothetical protein
METSAMELARQFRIRVNVVYDVIYTLQTKKGKTFKKTGNRYNFTPDELDMITTALKDRGHRRMM